ncbi:MAG TPA: glycoside hydrolase, partial [Bacteroidetes bacterium]|nr:glycoside hydrolase [Bacteroidota bacterium]
MKLLIFSAILIFLSSCKSTEVNSKSITVTPSKFSDELKSVTTPKFEMRGVWISTVVNLDWPSEPDLTVEKQRNELVFLFDQLYQNGFNAVFFQIRTESDALYNSPYEPWSYFLTKKQGKAPEPFYDPLEFAIDLAHERGMELHAWLNPFRTSHDLGAYPHAESHVIKRHPEWIMTFKGGRTYSMLNPGIKDVRDYVATIVADIVRRYDVDGIHFDDYFYPYTPPIGTEDRTHFQADGRGISDIKDWRRDNINLVISQVRDSINAIDPLVKYGISPFGIRLNS